MSSVLSPSRPSARRFALARPDLGPALPWVARAPGAPYFALDTGEPWTPVGANEAITWPGLAGLFRRRDLAGAEAYLVGLRDAGVTVLRLMLEYAQGEHRYFERPAGRYVPAMVCLWDDLFALCARLGLRVLLTPFDTFWHWRRWHRHPYNHRLGGPCDSRTRFMACRATRALVQRRLAFATERWGASGVLFGWDLWNELHPAQAGNDERAVATMHEFVHEVGDALRALELRLHGRAHPQTASVFGPELRGRPDFRALVFRHPALDFASTHFYAERTIDHPRDTVAPAAAAGLLVEQALAEIVDDRPFLDSEHGPIHTFKDKRRTLSEAFDDEYHRHFQWAHLAAGAAGGGMRWPNRHPHVLTPGMRAAQGALARFLPLIDWTRFHRRPLSRAVVLRDARTADALPLVTADTPPGADGPPVVARRGAVAAAFACGDDAQAVAYLVRADALAADGRVRTDVTPRPVTLELPGLAPGRYVVTRWCPVRGVAAEVREVAHAGGPLAVHDLPLVGDLALAVRRAG